jgi:type I restriction enzyme S subunit
MVPNGWIHTTFEKHIDLLNGFAFKSANYSSDESDIQLLRGDNIEPGSLRWRGVKRWPANELAKFKKYQLEEHDFVIAMDRTWITSGLKVAEVKQSDLPCLLVQRVSRIRALPTLNQSLLRQYFSGHRFEQYVKSVQTETAVPHISPSQIKEFSFLLPPVPEQKKIAKILSAWDNAISTTECLIDNSKQQKKALMQQLLTSKKRLLADSGEPFEGEWEDVNIGSLGAIYSGGTPSTTNEEYWGGNIDWITPTDITKQKNVYINSSVRKISKEGLKNSSAKLVPKGSLLVCTRATIGEMAITSHEMCTNQGFKNIIPHKKTNIEFIYYLLSYEKHKLVSKASGSTFLELSKSVFESMKFKIPTINEQQKIAAVLTNADKEIELLEQQLSDLKQEKKALMQQLLTGKRRVKIN